MGKSEWCPPEMIFERVKVTETLREEMGVNADEEVDSDGNDAEGWGKIRMGCG